MRRILRALMAAGCVAYPLATLWAGNRLQPRLAALALAEHLGSMLVLGVVFGNTLRPGRTALVTRFAAARQPAMSPRLLRYTRGVTAAWTLFFAAMAVASLLLFMLGPLREWVRRRARPPRPRGRRATAGAARRSRVFRSQPVGHVGAHGL